MMPQIPKVYSIDKKVATDLIRESGDKMSLIASNLKHYLNRDLINRRIISLLCDCYSSNSHIVGEMSFFLEHNLVASEDNGEQVVVPYENITLFESAIISRFYAESQLQTYSISLVLN